MMKDNEITMVRITKHNRSQLLDMGKKSESFNDIITRLISFYKLHHD